MPTENYLELNKIYNEDCLETMAQMPDNFVDLIVADPPYGINKAEWDKEFPINWIKDAKRISKKMIIKN